MKNATIKNLKIIKNILYSHVMPRVKNRLPSAKRSTSPNSAKIMNLAFPDTKHGEKYQ